MPSALAILEYARLLRSLARFLEKPLTLEQSKAVIRQRLEMREERFLKFVARFIYGYTRSPYLPLLRYAGCEYGDLAAMVRQRGIERTLETLRNEGVYFSFEEFKGRTEVVRGSQTYRFSEQDFDNPYRTGDFRVRTGASRSRGSPISVTLDSVAENRAVCFNLMLDAVGADRSPLITWLPGYPSGSGMFLWLGLAHIGRPPIRWFAITDPNRPTVPYRHRMLLPIVKLLGRRRGLKLPMPEFTPLHAPSVVLDALLASRGRYGECTLITTPSAGVRVASLARRSNASLEGIRMMVGSEPLTSGKAEEIRGSGASVSARYVFTEGGAAGIGCGTPSAPDDMHFMADSFALILNRRVVTGVGELETFMFTSLLNFAPKIMLNVESDDFGKLFNRRCECPLDELGLHDHIASVRSFTKLTGEGATVLGTDCIRILEEVLPLKFGGSSIDYQLLEVEDEHHLTRLLLIVSPDVGSVDEQRVIDCFVSELWKGYYASGYHSGVPGTWIQANTIRVVRGYPVETAGGKLLPFHTQAFSTLRSPFTTVITNPSVRV